MRMELNGRWLVIHASVGTFASNLDELVAQQLHHRRRIAPGVVGLRAVDHDDAEFAEACDEGRR